MRFPFGALVGRRVGPFVPFQIVRVVGAVVAALTVTPVQLDSLVDRQVGLFVPFQIARVVGAEVAALMITLV